jgi:two-component system sensor histidine kinase/response regulator
VHFHIVRQTDGGPVPQSVPAARRLLIVDDDPITVKAMCRVLANAGFECVGCVDGAEALDKAVTGIHAAVVDIHLPDINGLELSQKLREILGPGVPIVILSGDHSMQTIRALPEAGATYFYAKPVNTGMLIRQLREWFAGERAAG